MLLCKVLIKSRMNAKVKCIHYQIPIELKGAQKKMEIYKQIVRFEQFVGIKKKIHFHAYKIV